MLEVWTTMPWLLPTATLGSNGGGFLIVAPLKRDETRRPGLSGRRYRQGPSAESRKSETTVTIDGADRIALSL